MSLYYCWQGFLFDFKPQLVRNPSFIGYLCKTPDYINILDLTQSPTTLLSMIDTFILSMRFSFIILVKTHHFIFQAIPVHPHRSSDDVDVDFAPTLAEELFVILVEDDRVHGISSTLQLKLQRLPRGIQSN